VANLKHFALERNSMNVQRVENPLFVAPTSVSIRRFTIERSPLEVKTMKDL